MVIISLQIRPGLKMPIRLIISWENESKQFFQHIINGAALAAYNDSIAVDQD
jgi:hypothetical protein